MKYDIHNIKIKYQGLASSGNYKFNIRNYVMIKLHSLIQSFIMMTIVASLNTNVYQWLSKVYGKGEGYKEGKELRIFRRSHSAQRRRKLNG